MQNLINRKFQKKAYRHMLVSEVKKEFGKDVRKYLDWEIEIFIYGLKMTGDFKSADTAKKYKKKTIDYILQHDNKIVQEVMLDYVYDLTRKES